MSSLMGLAIFGEKVAARTYLAMADLRADHGDLLRKFAAMEARHGSSFLQVSRANAVEPDREFADRELGYLVEQVERYARASDFDALAVLQGFIVESLAIATYEPFLGLADTYPGAREAFATALADERYHVDWITRYLRLRYFGAVGEFLGLAERVNTQGIDCVGGSLMSIAGYLDVVGLSGAQCAAGMLDGYAGLLEDVGLDQRTALRSVTTLFAPLMAKYRRREHR
ncbi:MAG TPA: long-chain fatty aldehyde decarbonylase [Candidatus Eisenbacteria bacterium]|nr:long-chain fatty aldehyde decarbonylase [Candidatus Eisenbacteria bacterium]